MATFASDFDKHSVPMPTWSTPTPTVPSSPGAQADALGSLRNDSPELFSAPKQSDFINSSYYNAAKTKYDTYGNWITPENGSQLPINATSAGLQSIQSQMQQRAGLSGQIDPNLTQDAFAGNIAMQQRQQSQQSYGSPAPTQAPAASQQFGGQSDALSRYLAQASQTVANYKPEAVQGSGANPKGYTVTNSGLSEPDPSQFTSQADYQTALNAYAKLKQTEELTALQSDAQNYVNSQNAYQKMIDETTRRTLAVEEAQKEMTRIAGIKRNDLANRLAARGISENTDSSAQQQFAELDRLNSEAQQAAAQAAALDSQEFMTSEQEKLSAALKARVAEIQVQQDKIAAVEQGAAKNAADLLLIEKKKEEYDSKIADRATDNERDARELLIKEMLGPAQYANLMAKTDYTGAQTDYLSGAKTDLTNAQVGKTEAQTNRITTLLPAELAKMQAMTTKLLTKKTSGGGGGVKTTVTPEELEAVYRLNQGKAPTSDKAMAQLLNQVRTVNGNVDSLVEAQNTTAANRASTVKEATNKVSNSSGSDFKSLFVGQ